MLLPMVALVAACGQADLGSALSGMTGASKSNNSAGGIIDPWAGVETSASSSNMFGTQGFEIDKNNNLLKLVVDLPVNIFGGSMRYDISELPGSFVAIEPNPNSGQWQLSFNVPLQYLVKGVNLVGPKTLPNGDDLPGVPGGEPPRIAGHIVKGKLDLYIYGSVKYFGIYVPTPGFNPFLDLTFPIKNKDKTKILGYFATVSEKRGFSGGLFISIVFPPELARVLDDLFG